MPEYTTILGALAMLAILGVVLATDFFCRRGVYNHSDPISLALLLFSFLLVLTDTGLNILSQITEKAINVPLLIAGAIYLALVTGVYQFTSSAHKNFKAAQDEKIKDYLKTIRENTTAPEAVWRALEALGTNAIEPDVFVQNKIKRRRRVDYLKLVKDLTGADIKPEDNQVDLLVDDVGVRRVAQTGYIVAFCFGLASTLFFFFFRLR